MAMSASDNKGDKKDDGKDKDKDKGQKPILIVTWEFAWPPVFREVSESDSFEIGLVPPQEIQQLIQVSTIGESHLVFSMPSIRHGKKFCCFQK